MLGPVLLGLVQGRCGERPAPCVDRYDVRVGALAANPQGSSTRMEQNLVMGFDSCLSKGVHRTEVFVPYLWRKTPLIDDEFTGVHPFFWQKSSTDLSSAADRVSGTCRGTNVQVSGSRGGDASRNA